MGRHGRLDSANSALWQDSNLTTDASQQQESPHKS